VSNAFYAQWLDTQRVCSCAYFKTPDDTLDQAQKNKLEHICGKLRLQCDERLLEIGCGTGALVCWAARHHRVHAHGITHGITHDKEGWNHTLRRHYALTLRHWVQRLEANRDAALC
jgi:cyclopropane fatty-acyl-phospholipid synthase-like methyltransferase